MMILLVQPGSLYLQGSVRGLRRWLDEVRSGGYGCACACARPSSVGDRDASSRPSSAGDRDAGSRPSTVGDRDAGSRPSSVGDRDAGSRPSSLAGAAGRSACPAPRRRPCFAGWLERELQA
jgi:hypothetical protein